jgi:hypothetical protein
MLKKIAAFAIPVLYEIAVLFALYDFSLHSDYVPWGNSRTDGLDMLSFFILSSPAMLVLSLAKMFLWKENNFFRFNYLLYTVVFFVIAWGCLLKFTAVHLLIIMLTASFVAIIVMVEFWIERHKLSA